MADRSVDRGPEIRDAVDRSTIEQLVIELVWRCDHERDDTVHELFVDEGVMVLNHGWGDLRGVAAIARWGRERTASLPRARQTRHICGNTRVVFGSDESAEGSTVVTIYMSEPDDNPTAVTPTIGEYIFSATRRDGRWRLLRWEMVAVFAGPATFDDPDKRRVQ